MKLMMVDLYTQKGDCEKMKLIDLILQIILIVGTILTMVFLITIIIIMLFKFWLVGTNLSRWLLLSSIIYIIAVIRGRTK